MLLLKPQSIRSFLPSLELRLNANISRVTRPSFAETKVPVRTREPRQRFPLEPLGWKFDRMALADTEKACSGGEQAGSEVALNASVLGGFSHIDETKALISSLPEVHAEMLSRELATERFGGETFHPESNPYACSESILFAPTGIMNLYQEQPHLLDPHLGTCQDNTSKFKERKIDAILRSQFS